MTAASPAASVSVPTDGSSSTRRKSEAAKRDSSRRDLSSAPRREEAPAMAMRVEAMSCQLKIIREAGRWSEASKERLDCGWTGSESVRHRLQVCATERRRRVAARNGGGKSGRKGGRRQ